MGCGRRAFKALFGALALVVFIWLVFTGVLDAGGMNTTTTTTVKLRPEGSFKPIDRTNLNYMSKRRVPNGPDPIHNRYYLNVFASYPICKGAIFALSFLQSALFF